MDLIEQRIEEEEAAAEKTRLEMYAEPEPEAEEADPLKAKDADTPAESENPDEPAVPEKAVVEPDELPPTPEEEETFKSKYLTLKGKYDKEVPASAAVLKALRGELTQWKEYAGSLETRVKSLEAAPKVPEPKETPAVPTLNLEDPGIKTLIEDYPGMGKLLESFEAKQAEDARVIADLKAKVETGFKTLETDTQASRFESTMSTLVGPDWKTTDADPQFFAFLGEEVPYTGKTRLQLLQAASAAFDAQTVAKFFNDFKSAAVSASAEEDTGVAPKAVDDKLKKQLAPPRSGGRAPANPEGQEPVYTLAQYNKFMDDSTNGKFRSKDWGGKTEVQMDAIFDRALAENRLVA